MAMFPGIPAELNVAFHPHFTVFTLIQACQVNKTWKKESREIYKKMVRQAKKYFANVETKKYTVGERIEFDLMMKQRKIATIEKYHTLVLDIVNDPNREEEMKPLTQFLVKHSRFLFLRNFLQSMTKTYKTKVEDAKALLTSFTVVPPVYSRQVSPALTDDLLTLVRSRCFSYNWEGEKVNIYATIQKRTVRVCTFTRVMRMGVRLERGALFALPRVSVEALSCIVHSYAHKLKQSPLLQ